MHDLNGWALQATVGESRLAPAPPCCLPPPPAGRLRVPPTPGAQPRHTSTRSQPGAAPSCSADPAPRHVLGPVKVQVCRSQHPARPQGAGLGRERAGGWAAQACRQWAGAAALVDAPHHLLGVTMLLDLQLRCPWSMALDPGWRVGSVQPSSPLPPPAPAAGLLRAGIAPMEWQTLLHQGDMPWHGSGLERAQL